MNDQTSEYHSCAICRSSFNALNQPALFEDGFAYCSRCAYDISMIESPTAL